jgi:hypothetical protein
LAHEKQGWVTEEEEVRKNTQPRCSSILQTSKSFASKKPPSKLLRTKKQGWATEEKANTQP